MSSNGIVDLRSDTVTTPTDTMRRAMADAEVGDDCYGEDPTINRLQDLACEMLGTEAALYVPSGTMANQIAVKTLAEAGGEVVCDGACHLIHHESGACALLAQVQLRGLHGERGVLRADDVRAAIRPGDRFQPRTVLVAVENTHNALGGTVWPLDGVRSVIDVATELGVPTFCDGARLPNASVAAGVSMRDYAAGFDLVTISLYKGLSAPMGSLVCGGRDVIDAAWRFRRVFGGALRQGGVVAAAGIVGLETMVDRLAEDHVNARALAEGIKDAAPGAVDLDQVQTNMVIVDAAACGSDTPTMLGRLKAEGVLAGPLSQTTMRFVTHKDVDAAGIDRAVAALRRIVTG